MSGKSSFKEYISEKIELNFSTIPVNQSVLDYIQKKRKNYSKVNLITGSHEKNANGFSQVYNYFDEVVGTTEALNLIGKNKVKYIEDNYGEFDYIGDSKADHHVWKKANKAIFAGKSNKVWVKLKTLNSNNEKIEVESVNFFKASIKAIRVHQWAKNMLIFVAIILSHQYLNFELFKQSVIAFFAFSFTASSVYLLNDLSDLDADRVHKRKKFRPIPAGDISPFIALSYVFVLISSAAFLTQYLPIYFALILGIYFVITSLYSFRLKRVAILDIVLLAVLFTIRLLAGHFATEIVVSPWLLTFSIFIFSSLACLKRSTELKDKLPAKDVLVGRGYCADDYFIINQIGITTGIIATLVMALYLNSSAVLNLYSSPYLLWMICPILIYWIGRLWMLGVRGLVHDDPVVYVVKDKVSLFIGLTCLVLVVLAR